MDKHEHSKDKHRTTYISPDPSDIASDIARSLDLIKTKHKHTNKQKRRSNCLFVKEKKEEEDDNFQMNPNLSTKVRQSLHGQLSGSRF